MHLRINCMVADSKSASSLWQPFSIAVEFQKIKSSIYSRYYAERVAGPNLRDSTPEQHSFEALQRGRADEKSVYYLTGLGIKPQTSVPIALWLATELTAGALLKF